MKRFVHQWGVGVGLLLGSMLLYAAPASLSIQEALGQLRETGALMLNAQQEPLVEKDPSKLRVPASTTKLVTAYLALKHWGAGYRFKTDFYVTRNASDLTTLCVKGYGDPFLVSEEIQKMARRLALQLKEVGVGEIDNIILDTGYFESNVVLPGRSNTDNPYDAIPGALAANFNTLYLKKRNGKLVSAESQTPLTPLAIELGKQANLRHGRFNLGGDARMGERYFAELLSAFLQQSGVQVKNEVQWRSLKDSAVLNGESPFYRHQNTLTLAEMIRPMMQYSTNFIANQLALKLSAEKFGPPASAEKVKRMMKADLTHYLGWQDFYLEDGAGLSHQNRLSPQQLVLLLQAFRPWKSLLPEVEDHIFAKSGTLIGVSALAGYIYQQEQWLPFALMINQPVPFAYKNQLALKLKQQLENR
ncbi:D-alanyl-D-alanine carboxypeptidase [Hydrogenovibrio sp. 3SP14C1]|uniref:D-alanyl-D-alanine carboxypeptidase/D-alanyl-D-alanine-endopeptidase n=1 Tax=Hydrogenovibrio sp. 3SP14C1 TaxID=3038774 RepID=UPI0024168483|nr:D-alanyl-D-alanine carboxypeptidase [Hydrogenovibrio sp. 3SP14C1]MDG4813147.1 D-alanyl-D-alanine carboxypeptidase [Hydrogenovibrio sp. 3SP14C1]